LEPVTEQLAPLRIEILEAKSGFHDLPILSAPHVRFAGLALLKLRH
jgi:hypothetical protein